MYKYFPRGVYNAPYVFRATVKKEKYQYKTPYVHKVCFLSGNSERNISLQGEFMYFPSHQRRLLG